MKLRTLDGIWITAGVVFLFLSVVMMVVNVPVFTPFLSYTTGGTVTLTQDTELLAANATIIDVVSGHAWREHGTQVNDAFRCLNQNGSTRAFKTFGFQDRNGRDIFTNLWLCKDGDNWYAIVTTTLQKVGGNRVGKLVTAYLVDKKLFPNIESFIIKIQELWSAQEINFVIEAGSVFLSPK